MDWDAPATVHERDDCGSDRNVDFHELAKGTLAEMVRFVCGIPAEERARVVLDSAGRQTMTVGEAMALSEREDFPAR